MSSHQVEIKIDDSQVRMLRDEQYAFCFAVGSVGAGGPDASHDVVYKSVQIRASTSPVPISFGDSYLQPADLVSGTVKQDPSAPRNGFLFINQTPQYPNTVYKKVKGKWTPVFVNPAFPDNVETWTSKTVASIWFSKATETARTVTETKTKPFVFDLLSNNMEVSFDKAGQWTTSSNS
ncbi:MAG: hypothetical protein M1828_005398 [Chrysothrix sp. TS-e1954]|nr:MAG: hypothetical protein M1828_005398 [Chrysothrix sp. TS-e1954]